MIVLDTHLLLWADGDDSRLGRKARALIDRLLAWPHAMQRHDARK